MKFLKDAFNVGNLYVLLWTVHTVLTMTDIGFDIIRQLSLMFCLLVSLYCYVEVLRKGKLNGYMRALSTLFIMFMVYGLILVMSYSTLRVNFQSQSQPTYWFIEEMMKSILPLFAFYYFSEKGHYTKTILRVWVIVFIVAAVYIYLLNTSKAEFAMIDFSSEQRVNSYAYIVVSILPGLALFDGNRIIQAVIMLITIVFAVIGMKRGAILVSAACVLWYSLVSMKKSSTWSKILWVILAIVIVRVSMDLFGFMADNNAFFSDRVDATLSGGTSGRDRIASHLLNYYFNEANFFEELFGSGAYATIRVYDNFAHNDWLEILICEGLLGIALYLYYWYSAIKTAHRAKYNREAYLAISLFVIIYFFKTFFSMSINDMSIMSTLVVGYYLSVLSSERKNMIKRV